MDYFLHPKLRWDSHNILILICFWFLVFEGISHSLIVGANSLAVFKNPGDQVESQSNLEEQNLVDKDTDLVNQLQRIRNFMDTTFNNSCTICSESLEADQQVVTSGWSSTKILHSSCFDSNSEKGIHWLICHENFKASWKELNSKALFGEMVSTPKNAFLNSEANSESEI